ncbi:MAG: hypothetical protein HQM02_03570 [Magnetococcales bacterium]|nr:hypothetical protein [Magnetococcales bacterium]
MVSILQNDNNVKVWLTLDLRSSETPIQPIKETPPAGLNNIMTTKEQLTHLKTEKKEIKAQLKNTKSAIKQSRQLLKSEQKVVRAEEKLAKKKQKMTARQEQNQLT